MRRLKNTFTGRAGERIPHDFLNCLANFYNDFNVIGGGLLRRDDGKNTSVIIPRSMADDLLSSFLIIDTSGTVCTMEPGSFFRDTAQKTIVGLPATIQCGSTQIGAGTLRATWLQYDTRLGTCQWKEGTVTATSSGTIEIYPVHQIQSDGTNIGTIHHEHPANFHTFSPEGTTGTWQDMGTSAEHADSAASDTWTNNGTKGLKLTAIIDLGYDHTAGTPRLFAVKRTGTFDLYGNLLNKGTETIVEIDQPISHALLGT
jgi:hypothetical protein